MIIIDHDLCGYTATATLHYTTAMTYHSPMLLTPYFPCVKCNEPDFEDGP